MPFELSPLTIAAASLIGTLAAYMARRRGKNPYLWFALGFFFGVLGIIAFFLGSKPKPKEPLAPPEPVFALKGPIDKFWYYLDAESRQKGPMSKDALTAAFKAGHLNLNTYVWNEELPEWKLLKDLTN